MSQFLLIHGAGHGAWCWHKASPALEQSGHRVRAVDLPGQGQDQTPLGDINLGALVERVVSTILDLPAPVVLVGHSLAGMVISAAAENVPERIKTLVYLAAFLPRDGESLLAIEQRNPKPTVPQCMIFDADRISATIMPEKVRELLYHDCTDTDVAYACARLRPQALAPLSDPVHLTPGRFGRVPRVFVECTDDHALSIELQRDMVAKSSPVEVRRLHSGHSPFFSMPDRMAAVLADL